MKTWIMWVKGFDEPFMQVAETLSKAKYKQWLKSANVSGYWKNFFDFASKVNGKRLYKYLQEDL